MPRDLHSESTHSSSMQLPNEHELDSPTKCRPFFYATDEGEMYDDICSRFASAGDALPRPSKVYTHINGELLHVTLVSSSRQLTESEWPRHVYVDGSLIYQPGENELLEDREQQDESGRVRLYDSRVFRIETTVSAYHENVDTPNLCGCLYCFYNGFTNRHFVWINDRHLIRCEPTGSGSRLQLTAILGGTALGTVSLLPGHINPYQATCIDYAPHNQTGTKQFDTLNKALAHLASWTSRPTSGRESAAWAGDDAGG